MSTRARRAAFLLPLLPLSLLRCSQRDDGAGTGAKDPAANADGDCLTDAEEFERGTDPNEVDTDGDGVSDCNEIACVSDPLDESEKCYACGWKHNDPGDLASTGKNEGDVIGNMQLVDQCLEPVSLWDFATTPRSPSTKPAEYHILVMSGAW